MSITTANFNTELLPGVSYESASRLENAIKEFISSRELALYRMMSFQLGWVDEHGEPSSVPTRPRLHGQFAFAIASVLSDSSESIAERVVPYGVSLELLQNYSQIHEDVEDGNTEHNGRPSVWWTWGPAQAINAGDGMHAMARMALFALLERDESPEIVSSALKSLDEAAVHMCEGEYLDITMQEQPILTSQSYLEMVSMRSGALFATAAAMASSAAARPELADALSSFGRHVGTARQIAADYLLFWGDGDRDPVQQGRLLTKKKNFAVASAIENAPAGIKRQIGEIYMQRVIDPQRLDGLVGLLNEVDCRQKTIEQVETCLSQAADSLDETPLDESEKARLSEIASAVSGFANSGAAEVSE